MIGDRLRRTWRTLRGQRDPDAVGVLHVRPAPSEPTRPRIYIGQVVLLIPLRSEQPNAAPVPVKIVKTTRERGTIEWLGPEEFRAFQHAEAVGQRKAQA